MVGMQSHCTNAIQQSRGVRKAVWESVNASAHLSHGELAKSMLPFQDSNWHLVNLTQKHKQNENLIKCLNERVNEVM